MTFDAELDLLYWRAQENGLGYAVEEVVTVPQFDWSPGVRAALGYHFSYNGWEIQCVFTHYCTNNINSVEGELAAVWANPFFVQKGDFVDRAWARWRLHFGMLDLLLAKSLQTNSWIDVRPFIGFRGASIRHKYKIRYFGGTLFPDGEDQIHSKNKFFGGGILAGIDAIGDLGKGWNLYAGGALSLLWGEFYIHEAEYATVGVERRLGYHDLCPATLQVIDLELGIAWERGRWSLQFSWEEHLFFGQNQLVRFVDNNAPGAYVSNQGDLGLQGFVLGASVLF
jgi:hypothetical protein